MPRKLPWFAIINDQCALYDTCHTHESIDSLGTFLKDTGRPMALGNTMSSRLQNFRKPWKWRCSSLSGSESLSCCACAYSVFVHYGMTWYFVEFVDILSIERQERHGLGIVFRAILAMICRDTLQPCDCAQWYTLRSIHGIPRLLRWRAAAKGHHAKCQP